MLARRWRVSAPLRAALVDHVIDDVPGAARTLLDAHIDEAIERTARVLDQTADLLTHLGSHGIRTVAFKGVALIAALYRDPARRKIADADILIAEHDLEATYHALLAAGMTPSFGRSLDVHRDFLASRSTTNNHSLTFTGADGLGLDVHWRLGDGPRGESLVRTLIDRSLEVPLNHRVIRVARPSDLMALTAHHIVRSDVELGSILKDLGDLLAWWTMGRDGWSVDDVVASARSFSLESALLAGWMTVARFNGSPALRAGIDEFRRLSPASTADASSIDALFAHALERAYVNQDLVAWYQPGAASRMLTARLMPWRRTSRRQIRTVRTEWTAHRIERQAHPWRRLRCLVRDAVRQSSVERAGYQALAAVRRQTFGDTPL